MRHLLAVVLITFTLQVHAHNDDDHAEAPSNLADEDTDRVDGHGETRRTADGARSFCSEPNADICSRSLPRAEFEAARRPIQERIIDNTFTSFQGRIPGLTREKVVTDLSSLKDTNFDSWMGLFTQLTNESEKELKARLGADFDLKSQFEGEIKTAQAAAVDAHADIPAATKAQMKAAISRAQFVMPSEYIARIRRMPQAQARQFMKFYQSTCGQLGMSDNAFSFGGGDARGGPGIVICPGTWIAGLALKGNNGTAVRDYIIFTLGHELGHKIDSGSFPAVFRKMQSCLSGTSAGRGFKPSTVKDPRGGTGRVQNNAGLEDYMDEISADYWAAETLARLRPGSSSGDMQNLSRSTLQDMCPSAGNGSHPPGKFRVNFMARNPRLLARVGCPQPNRDNPACGVEGVANSGGTGPGLTIEPIPSTPAPRPSTGPTPSTPPNSRPRTFADRAEDFLNRVSPQAAFAAIRNIRDRNERKQFAIMFQARYTVDPANFRRAFFDPNSSPELREAVKRETERRLGSNGVKLISSAFGVRPEHAMIYEDRLRRAVSQGREADAAELSAGLFGTLSRPQIEKALGELQSDRNPRDRNIVAHLVTGAKEALGRPPSNNRAENFFRGQFARSFQNQKANERNFRVTLDRAVDGDAKAREQLLEKNNRESMIDIMRHQLDAGGDETMAVKIAKTFGRKDEDGVYHLDLGARSVDFGHGEDTPHEVLRLGSSDDEIKSALRAFPDLHRFTIDPNAPTAKNRVFVRADGKGGTETYEPKPPKKETPAPIVRPNTISNAEAVASMKKNCAGCHGPGGKNSRFLDENSEVDLTKTSISAMVKNLKREEGSNPMPPIGSSQSLALYPSERNALVQWLQSKERQ